MRKLLFVATLLAVPALAQAGGQYGEKNLVIWRSSSVVQTETMALPSAHSGSVLGLISISSPTAGGTFEVFDSSITTLTGKELLSGVISCNNIGEFYYAVEADEGLTYRSLGACKATVKFLRSR